MAFNVVYADKDKIKSSIEQGIIPTESLILTNGDNQSEAFYYDDNGKLKQVTKKSSFNSMTEALSWINKNDYSGEIISILENGKWNSYIVVFAILNKFNIYTIIHTCLVKGFNILIITYFFYLRL